jgi:hypothetical protein
MITGKVFELRSTNLYPVIGVCAGFNLKRPRAVEAGPRDFRGLVYLYYTFFIVSTFFMWLFTMLSLSDAALKSNEENLRLISLLV